MYVVVLLLMILEVHASIYPFSCLSLTLCPHTIFMPVLLWTAAVSCSSSSGYSVSFSCFLPEQVDILNCIILIVWYMCLEEQQEVATEVNAGSSPYVWGGVILPLWDYPSASHLSSSPRHETRASACFPDCVRIFYYICLLSQVYL